MDGASLPDRWAISSEAAHSWQIWEICCRLNSMRLCTSPIMSGFSAPVWYPCPVWNMSRTFSFSYIENIWISYIIREGENEKSGNVDYRSTWKALKGVWWSVRCAETEAHVYKSHAALLLGIPQPRFEPSRRPHLCFHTADLLMCRITQLRILFFSVCLTGAQVCYRPWMRAMSWTWSTSQRGSFLSPSPATWKSRAMQPTCVRLLPCCAPNMAKTTWYGFSLSPSGIRPRNLTRSSNH